VQQEIDKIQISDEGVVALPHSVTSALGLQPGDEVFVLLDGTKVVLQRMNPKRIARSEPRPVGHGRDEVHMQEGWEAPMTDEEVDDFLNGR
jgi:bifunctional DNA-binding transcriptional regulator/antitoxin component of YhaV-PrlF toxin-antitoxin module